MNQASLIFAALWHRRLSVLLTLITLALSVTLFLSVSRLQSAAKTSFLQTVSGLDLIVAPRDSDISIMLYSVFGVGAPSDVLEPSVLEQLQSEADVAWLVPAAMGDSHRGFQVLGSKPALFEHLRLARGDKLTLAQGTGIQQPQDLVLGAEVARRLGYGLGQKIELSHGLGVALTEEARHQEKPFVVSGILAATGTPFDRRLYIDIEDMDGLHTERFLEPAGPDLETHADEAHADEAHADETHADGAHTDETHADGDHKDGADMHEAHADEAHANANFAFVGLKAPTLALRSQARLQDRAIYTDQALSAVLPGLSLARLWGLVGQAEAALRLIAWLVLAVALLGLVAMLVASLNGRRREMAIFRALGARPLDVAALLLTEALVIAVLGLVLGLALTQAATAGAAGWVAARYGLALSVSLPSLSEALALLAIFSAAMVAALIPAALAYRQTLADGLAPQT